MTPETYPPLGLGPFPVPIRLYVGQETDGTTKCGWYTFDPEKDLKQPIADPSLTGFIKGIILIEKTSKRGDTVKLDITIQADKPYIVRSGLETLFTRGLLLALDLIESFDQPVTIGVVPGTEEKTVFARVYHLGAAVRYEKNDKAQLHPYLMRLAKKLGQEAVEVERPGEQQPHRQLPAPLPTAHPQSTTAQHDELKRIAKDKQRTVDELNVHCRKRFNGRDITQLTYEEAETYTKAIRD